ncbi:hypothetical protein [Pectobacterium parmentieri]|uniref:hypothetical protein n=1 Tax=Pectobacterium parmentieri TaxID=1905730 RepID=UPI000B31F6F9|nr:hypothetical protein [Pectobacterium parmentieri]
MKVGALPDRHARLDSVWLDESTSLVHYTYNTQSQVATVTRQGGSVHRRFTCHDGQRTACLTNISGRECSIILRQVGGSSNFSNIK